MYKEFLKLVVVSLTFFLLGLVIADRYNDCDIDNSVVIGQIWLYESSDPFDKIESYRKVIDIKDDYIKYLRYYKRQDGKIDSSISSGHISLFKCSSKIVKKVYLMEDSNNESD